MKTSAEAAVQAGAGAPSWRGEIAGSLGDLGTLLPYLVGFITLAGVDATSVLLAFGLALLAAGWRYRLPFPVQPMKAIGAAALAQGALGGLPAPTVLMLAAAITGVFWLAAARTGVADWLARHVSRDVVHGIVLGLGLALVLQALQHMAADPWVGGAALLATLVLLGRGGWLLMPLLLAAGVALGLWRRPELAQGLFDGIGFALPRPQWGGVERAEVWIAALALAAAQVPLTLGNAVLGVVAEARRLFPAADVREADVARSTGWMNLLAAALGAPPMCHGAGGLAAQVAFGARSGRAPMLLGALLVVLALTAAAALATLLALLPPGILGALLFAAGLSLAIGTGASARDKPARAVLLGTAAVALWHPGAGLVFGVLLEAGLRRGLFRL
jgi:hypothetical protein